MALESTEIFGLSLSSVGVAKALALGAAGLGAIIMATFRPPKTRKEMFYQGLTALGSSFLFGDTLWQASLHYLPFIVDRTAVYGLLGALSWGVFGGLAMWRDKLGSKSIDESIKDISSL